MATLAERFTGIPSDIMWELARSRLTGREMRTLMAILQLTLGYGKRLARIPLRKLEEITGICKSNLVNVTKSLQEKGLIERFKIKNRLHFRVVSKFLRTGEEAEKKREPETSTGPSSGTERGKGENRATSARDASKAGEAGKAGKTEKESILKFSPGPSDREEASAETERRQVPKRNPEGKVVKISPREGEESQKGGRERKIGPYERETVKKITSLWEKQFGERFPETAKVSDFVAADYMLSLLESGRILNEIRSPLAYLRTIARQVELGTLEPFDLFHERKEKRQKVAISYEKLLERERKKAEERLKREAELERKVEEMWKGFDEKVRNAFMAMVATPNIRSRTIIEARAKKLVLRLLKEGRLEETCARIAEKS